MAKINYRKQAMINLDLTIADLRDPRVRDAILIEAIRLEDQDRTSSSKSSMLTQAKIAQIMNIFPGFSKNPDQYGPTVAEITDAVNAQRDENDQVSRNRVAQHLAKMRTEEIIGSAPKMETSGKRGRPEVFYFLLNEEMFNKIQNGDYTAKG